MSELSPDARELIAQAQRHGPELLGPSPADRERLRARLTPLWQSAPAAPRGRWLRRVLGSLSLLASVGFLCWRLLGGTPEQPAAVSGAVQTAAMPEARAEVPAAAPAGTEAASALPPSPMSKARELPAIRSQVRPQTEAKSARSAQAKPRERSAAAAHDAVAPRSDRPPQAGAAPRLRPGPTGVASTKEPDIEPAQATIAPLTAAASEGHARAVRTMSQPGPRSIEGELELLGEAQSALQAQRPSRALSLLQEHAFRFPRGALSDERMAMQALALCALDRRHAASSVLADLAARGARSALLPRVRKQCGL